MEIRILQLLEGARKARGLAVIIDVFRAFSTACYAFSRGVERIYPVADIDEALRMKALHPGYLLAGERNERMPAGFDFGNSPSQLLDADLTGKTMIHTTSSGTQGIAHATEADEIITGSFVNASSVVNYIQMRDPETVSLVCMGYACRYPVDEDTLCAEYIKNQLTGKDTDLNHFRQIIRKGTGARFFDPGTSEWAPSSDFDLCLFPDKFSFVLKVEKEQSPVYLKKIDR